MFSMKKTLLTFVLAQSFSGLIASESATGATDLLSNANFGHCGGGGCKTCCCPPHCPTGPMGPTGTAGTNGSRGETGLMGPTGPGIDTALLTCLISETGETGPFVTSGPTGSATGAYDPDTIVHFGVPTGGNPEIIGGDISLTDDQGVYHLESKGLYLVSYGVSVSSINLEGQSPSFRLVLYTQPTPDPFAELQEEVVPCSHLGVNVENQLVTMTILVDVEKNDSYLAIQNSTGAVVNLKTTDANVSAYLTVVKLAPDFVNKAIIPTPTPIP